ncbi:protein lin-54 homolog [Tubulanus polymorphus]|uniref:protein lin-54 homolog n=1 Tax=Tubulanus polymorphus TaxID=672921 RepID=UPI003DA2484F
MTSSLALGAISQPAENELVALQNIQAELDRIQGVSTSASVGEDATDDSATGQTKSGADDVNEATVGSNETTPTAERNVTKVIVKKPTIPITPQVLPLPRSTSQTAAVIGLPAASPTKTITISKGGLISPAKILMSSTTTPPKNILPKNKLPLSKTPTKITMIPVSAGKSPQKILSGALTVLPKGAVLTSVATDSSSKMLTLSPSRTGSIALKPPQQTQSRQSIVQLSKPLSTINQGGTIKQITIPIPGNTVQQIQVPGSKFNYIRLVSNPASGTQSQGGKVATIPMASINQVRQIAPATGAPVSAPMKIATVAMNSVTQQQIAAARLITGQSSQPVTQRILLPATTSVVRSTGTTLVTTAQIRPPSGGGIVTLPPGATLLSTGDSNTARYTLLPAQYISTNPMKKPLVRPVAPSAQATPVSEMIVSESLPLAEPPSVSRHTNGSSSAETAAPGQRPRKPCNCTKSQCLKLYCDCFANGEFCSNCNCTTCANNLEHEEERSRAIKSCLDRNPFAFHPKIGAGKSTGGSRRHNKGCNCKKSGCLKNYCECYEAKILCSNMCRCVGCKNYEESPLRKTLMNLADAAEVRVNQQAAVNSKLSSQMSDVKHQTSSGERLPYTFITPEVVEATCACLLAQAEDGERTRQSNAMQEKMILEEFGRCLLQIVESANRTRAQSPMQQ